jgi:hypothetical protein
MQDDDPEKRIADLERQLAEAKAAAGEHPEPIPPASLQGSPQSGPMINWKGSWISTNGGDFQQFAGSGAASSAEAQQRIVELAGEMAEAFQEHLRTGNDWGDEIKKRSGAFNNAISGSGLSPEQFSRAYRQAAVDAQMGGQGFSSAGPVDTHLADPPRRIPLAFRLAELLPFRWWYIFALFMVGIAVGVGGIAFFIQAPAVLGIVYVVTLVAIYALQFAGSAKRFALLKWGQVATVAGSEIASRATYYSGTTWGMAPLPIAHGWQVKRPLYSGPNVKTRVRYSLNGFQGELTVSGREYIDGVVLADSRNPSRALCVTSFAYDLNRDESGNWIGRIRPRLLLGMAVWVVVVIVWLGLAAGLLRGNIFGAEIGSNNVSTTASVPQGGALTVGPGSHVRTIACNDGSLTLSGYGNNFTVTGHCASLAISGYNDHLTVESAKTITVSGYGNTLKVNDCDNGTVTLSQYGNTLDVKGNCAKLAVNSYNNIVAVDSADTIEVGGYSNTVVYHSGEPQITDSGSSNTLHQG